MKKVKKDEPFYPISMAADLLGITADRLRTYEEEGLIKPHRVKTGSKKVRGYKRLYSKNELEWIENVRELIKSGITISAIKIILSILPYIKSKDLSSIGFLADDEDKLQQSWDVIIKLYKSPVYKVVFPDK